MHGGKIVMDDPRILCVGDIISGSFIDLAPDSMELTTDDKGYKRLSFELGAKLPYESLHTVTAVECAPNAAVSMSRLGLDASLMTWLGGDEVGRHMVEYLREQK